MTSDAVTNTNVPVTDTIAIKLNPFTLSGLPPAQAPQLWTWSYTGEGIGAGGTLTTASRPDTGGYYQISGITGSRNGDAIVGLEPTGDAIPGNEGYPVDNLINASGSLTANGFGYETASGNYANPYYGNYLNPPIYQEVFTQPESSGFSEVPVVFKAAMVPGVTIATGIPAGAADTLSLEVIQAPRTGVLSLVGTSVQYVPASGDPVIPVTFSFDVKDRIGQVTPIVTVIAAGNGSHEVTGAMSGYTDISLGNGDNVVALHGMANTVNLGNGNDLVSASGGSNDVTVGNGDSAIAMEGGSDRVATGNGNDVINLGGSGSVITLGGGTDIVHGGSGDTIRLGGNSMLTISGNNEMVFLGNGNSTVADLSTGLNVKVGPTAGDDVLLHFASTPGGVVDLIGGIGGFTTTTEVLSALTSDGHGGMLLSFDHGGSLDFAGVTASQLHAVNFQIG